MVAVVDSELLPFLEDEWTYNLPREVRPLSELTKINKQYHVGADWHKQETFIEFVEKLVIFDLITRSHPINFL